MKVTQHSIAGRGRRMGLFIAGLGVFWVLVNLLGADMGWSNRIRALLDLIVLAGFGAAFVYAIILWRVRRDDEDRG